MCIRDRLRRGKSKRRTNEREVKDVIKALNRIFKQDKERLTVPKSVQQVIPIKRVWPDGIWQVGNKFSRCWKFTDINYAIASKDDKTSMFLDYSELLNSLEMCIRDSHRTDRCRGILE